MTLRDPAGQVAIERLVNVYVRDRRIAVRTGALRLPLRRSRATLAGRCLHRSLVGHHRHGPSWWLETRGGRRRVTEPVELAQLLFRELDAAPGARRGLVEQVGDSLRRMRRYLRARGEGTGGAPTGLDAEQSLVTGHVLHPTPKAAGGFSDADTARFAPELGARFALTWLALRRHHITDAGEAGPLEALTAPVGDRLPDPAGWRVLPVHPWQHAELAACGALAAPGPEVTDLGTIGPAVAPTSSVRTVRLPWAPFDLKLPLEVRITNFVRTNPPEQLRRSRDADEVLRRLDLADLETCREPAARAPGLDSRWDDLGVLVRASPPEEASVVAALLEEGPGRPPVLAAIGGGDPRAWVRRYAQVTVGPLASVLVHSGASLEAHAQNALIVLDPEGQPERLVIRDLEGTSLDRSHPAVEDLVGSVIGRDSPALYATGECWQRFAYYVLVNHLGHVVSTLCRHLPIPEVALWHEIGEVLAQVAEVSDSLALEALLAAPSWPAKANLASRLLDRGETPLYVPIPNPLRTTSG